MDTTQQPNPADVGPKGRLSRILLLAILLSLLASAAIAISLVIVGKFGALEAKILGTTGSLAGFSVGASPLIAHLDRDRHRLLARFGLTVTATASIMTILGIWAWFLQGEEYWKTYATILLMAISTNLVGVVLFARPTHPAILGWRQLNMGLIVVVTTLVITAIWIEPDEQIFGRLIGALVILVALGILGVPIASRLLHREASGDQKGT